MADRDALILAALLIFLTGGFAWWVIQFAAPVEPCICQEVTP